MQNMPSTIPSLDWVSTNGIPGTERRDFWLDNIEKRLIRIGCPTEVQDGIEASLRHVDLGDLRLNHIRANTHSVQRSQADIAGDGRHSVFLCFMLAGQGFSYQGTHCVQHSPGDVVLYDTLMPYGHGFPDDMEMLVVDLPEPIARRYLHAWQRGNLLYLHKDTRFSCTSCDALFRLLAPVVDPSVSTESSSLLASELLENIEAIVCNICSGTRDRDVWQLCCQYIQENLQGEALTATRLAKALNISTRKLHRTFAQHGLSVQSYIWRQRLEQCRKEIQTASLANRSVSEIAFKWGFNDASHFSRRYKALYGESPIQTRKSGNPAK